ncbi:MAG TPA: 3'-5' exonuclease, partial [Leptospiraceae bacterium]|nr:3'-5' exonuclease [Leptospiraceae bacterium]
HASKGLEFHSVVLDLTSGWSSDSEISEEQKEEERRILYVALSRAKDELIIAGKYRPDKKEKKFLETEFFQYFKGLDELRLFPDA